MALQVDISGTTQIYFGGQTVLTASVVDTETGQTPAGLQYAWTAADGSFVGATNGASVTYHADFTRNTDQTVEITCEVTLPGNSNPTVSAPSLTAMDELGITGQLVNMLVTAELSGSDLFDRTDSTAIDAGSDTNLSSDIRIFRLRWSSTNRLTINRSGTGLFRDFWDATARAAYSAYFILNDGTIVELPGSWIPTGSGVGGGYMRVDVPSSETAVSNAIDSIATGQLFLFGIADTGSVGLPDVTASADATVNVRYNAPPNVTITAPQKVNPGDTVPISVTTADPEGRNVTVQWGATDGTIDNPTSLNPNFTASNQSGPVTLTCTARDADGVEGSNTHVIVVNSPPTVTITAPSRLEVGRTGNISIAVSDPNNDAVTILIETSAGSIDDPTAFSTIITAPDTPQTITVTCTATDADGLETIETAQITIIANQPPTLSIAVPNALEIGQTGNLSATAGDPTNDSVTVLWEVSAGVIGNQTALNTTITAPATPQTITVTCIATDDRGAMTTKTATITVRQPNRPPTVTLNVPATASPGQTINIEAIVDDLDGDNTTGEWRSPKGSIATPESASTTFTAPLEAGIVPLTYEAMDDMGATTSKTAYITVGDPKANIYTPAVRIEIEGVDVTDRRIPRDGLVVGKSLDYPELLTFRSAGISFNLDNADGAFDYNNPNNFFIAQGLPAHGRGAKVLVRIGLSQSELIPVFAGEISEVITRLGDTKARINTRDLSVRSRQKVIENFGIEITRRITDFEGAALDYDAFDPVFYFPIWGLPISRNSVSITVHQGETDIPINIVEAIKTEGVLNNRNAEIDYTRGLIRFEAPPDDAEATQITATWKRDYRYKRPDFLVRQTLKNTGVQDTLQISDDTSARFAIEQALLRHPTDATFSSHGRPYFEREGITRWLKHNPDTDKWLISIDTRLVEYDEYQDLYSEIATIPEDDTIDDLPPSEYGLPIDDETIDYNSSSFYGYFSDLVFYEDRIYLAWGIGVGGTDRIRVMDLDGNDISSMQINVANPAAIDVFNRQLYVFRGSVSNGIEVFNLSDGTLDRTIALSGTTINTQTSSGRSGLAITTSEIIIVDQTNSSQTLKFFDHTGTYLQNRDIVLPSIANEGLVYGIEATDTRAFVLRRASNSVSRVEVYNFSDGNEIPSLRFEVSVYSRGLDIEGEKIRTIDRFDQPPQTNDTVKVVTYFAADTFLNFQGFVAYQLDTVDFDSIYILATNTFRGDVLTDTAFNRVRVEKYLRSTNTWTKLLDPDTGQPQLAMPYDFINENRPLADNRKNFKVIRRDGKTLIFYRRVQAGSSSIAMFNETDDAITDVYSENHGGSSNYGLPYSMDFWTDERSDGIYVYTFVVRYTFSGNNFSSATLKVYRRRVQPIGTQSEIFSETFASTGGDDLYPVSVSDLILAPDRSKWYFTLDYQSEADAPGKAELCELPKDGGTRVARKTYTNPLLGPRSPAKVGNRYFYLEGGWIRLPKSDPSDDTLSDDERHYPNEAGHLIEIESNGDITDHGVIWRSRTKLDSPDPDPENPQYNGWGLHNAVVSNMVPDSRGNLRFIAGYGLPYRINNNLPSASITGAIPDESNFNWIQYGQDLATKIASFPTNGRRGWELIQQLAQIMNWEIGFGPAMGKVDAIQAADASITDWSANASFFFRPRTILPAKLRTTISASGSPTTIAINDSGLPADVSEFPVPPSGDRYTVIVDKEMFTYTGVAPDANGRTLTGVSRAQNGSVAAAHSIDAGVYFVDYFASGEQGTTLVSITNRSQDFVNLRNDINIGFGDTVYPTKKQRSIDENGEKTFNLGTSQPLLSRQDQAWAQLIGDTYLDELSDLKEVLQATLVFSPQLQPGQLLVVYQLDRVRIEFKLFRLLQVQHHTHPRWQTGVTALEIIPEGVPVRWLTVPRQLLRYNQNLNLDLKNYVAGTLPIQIEASGLPSGFSISNGIITGGSNTAGQHTISLTATNRDGEDTTNFEMLIGEPRWPSIPAQNITETDYFIFDFTSYLPEGLAPITYALGGSAPSWVSRSGDYILGQPPNESSDQTYIIPIIATNAVGASTVNIIVNVEDTI